MIVYKVYYKNYDLKKGELIGMLIERRNDLRGMAQVETGLKWAKSAFGPKMKEEKNIFVVPNELNAGGDIRWLMDKGVFTKEELPKISDWVGQALLRA
jgi:hypothetical protein